MPKIPIGPISSKETKNDIAWEKVFQAMPVLSGVGKDGFYDISAEDLKKYGEREARLMTKIDFRENLPSIMVEKELAILAISNGVYRIANFDPFIPISPVPASKGKYIPPTGLVSLKADRLTSECAFLDVALASGIMNQVFGEDVRLTIRGRQHCAKIDFQLNNVNFPVKGVQIEVDGGYEGENTINLVEAKVGGRENLSLRQILYPHKSWEKLVGGEKEVRSFVLFYQDPVLRFIPILEGVKGWATDHINERCFRFEKLATFDIRSVNVNPSIEPPNYLAPFPQADRFETVIAMLFMINAADGYTLHIEDLTVMAGGFGFDLVPRQINYYIAALVWLGLATKRKEIESVQLTTFGLDVVSMSHSDRLEALAKVIFREPLFHHVLHNSDAPPEALFSRWNLSGSTRSRRVQTITAWIKYFQEKIEED